MKSFKNAKFKWTFRDYQQRVLDNSRKYLENKKIHIVAAPGSGKTILGLELITRLNSPCIILSPTVTIRDQWEDRFMEAFLPDGERVSDYFSNDLNNIKLLNTITYQALHSAINNVVVSDDEEEIDYRNLDLFKIMRENKITTICLDEAHHLQNEWQKALEKFIKGLGNKVNIIALTATPPYDASEEEWKRYIDMCGDIDEEIFVPELVKQNTLCPHQDYVYFNYPTEEEINEFKEYRTRAYIAIDELVKTNTFARLYRLLNSRYNFNYGKVYKDSKGFTALLSLFDYAGLEVDKKIVYCMQGNKELEKLSLPIAESAVKYIANSDDLDEEEREEVLNIFKKHSLVNRGKVCLDLNEKLRKTLVSSTGKLESIEKIVKGEYSALKDKLRMLILTDYIKKESIVDIGTDAKFANISIVTIFEKIRRANLGVKLAALSGSVVILPMNLESVIKEKFEGSKKGISFKQINETEYAVCNINGTNRDKVTLLTELFKQGYIEVLVGTKSLLGEGWDSPCINSLILASFVGSFMLSNQMRGRAIRIYKDDPNKVSNIWHLVTLEPSYILDNNVIDNEDTIASYDYNTLSRRFTCFVGPNYNEGVIESGMDRLTFIKGPYNKEGIERINNEMMENALKRDELKYKWLEALGSGKLALVNVIDKQKRLPFVIPLIEISKFLLYTMAYVVALILLTNWWGSWFKIPAIIIGIIIFCASIKSTYTWTRIFFSHITSKKSIKSYALVVLDSLKTIKKIDHRVGVEIKETDTKDAYEVSLSSKASFEEERIFNKALNEFLSLVEEPRYLCVKKSKFKKRIFKISFAIPSSMSEKKEDVLIFNHFLSISVGEMEAIYTKSVYGKVNILHYLKDSYVIRGNKVDSKHKVI